MDELNITGIYSAGKEENGNEGKFRKETGFPSPARDHYERRLSLDEHIVQKPAATFFVRVQGDSMREAGIFSGDILVVDRSVKPESGHLVVAVIEDDYAVKKLEKKNGYWFLCSGSEDIAITDELTYEIWGVISHAIHKYI